MERFLLMFYRKLCRYIFDRGKASHPQRIAGLPEEVILRDSSGFFYYALLYLRASQMKKTLAGLLIIAVLPFPAKLSGEAVAAFSAASSEPMFEHARPQLWRYLRRGLNFLESPLPLQAPETVLPSYVHPDGRGYGPYGLSPAAYADVQTAYPYFRPFSWGKVLSSPSLYERASQAFCDLLLKHTEEYLPASAERQEVFDLTQKVWNLGLRGFKQGRTVVSSRQRRAVEFMRSEATDEDS